MNSIKLRINRLGKIRNSIVDVNAPLTIFFGESGLGKSYLAMLTHYFYAILYDKSSRLSELFKKINHEYKNDLLNFGKNGTAVIVKKRDIESFLAQDSVDYLKYLINNDNLEGDISVELPQNIPDEIKVEYHEESRGVENNEEKFIILSSAHVSVNAGRKTDTKIFDDYHSPYAFILGLELTELLLGKIERCETFCLPPSRGPMMTEHVDAVSGLYYEFEMQMENLERAKERTENVSTGLNEVLNTIIEGDIQKMKGVYQYITHGQTIPLTAAAASIRELAPLMRIAQKKNVSQMSFLFEEPEAHLHPLKQRMVADVVCSFVVNGACMQITTHSDYFLRRINEFILLHRLKQKNEEKFLEFCQEKNLNKNLFLDVDKIQAYYLYQLENDVVVEKQNLTEGIPFVSFQNAIVENFKMQDSLEKVLEEDCDR